MNTQTITRSDDPVTRPEPTRGGRTFSPAVDIIERNDELTLLADMPGVRAEDIDIRYERGLLSIYGRVKPRYAEDVAFLLEEYGVADFSRSFQVGEGIDASKIGAEVRQGVLTLRLPKTEATRTRKIHVRPA
jgi:HSP20 family protein